MIAAVVPPPMVTPWPVCHGRPMWFGPYGYGCQTCDVGSRAPRPVEVVELPVIELSGGQFALFDTQRAAA